MSDNNKREIQKKNRELAQKKARLSSSIKWIVIGVAGIAILGLIAWAVASSVVSKTNLVADYSQGLNDDGTIKNVKALDYVELFDYKNITVSRAELEPSDEEVLAYVDDILNQFPDVITDESLVIKNGDTIDLDYVGDVDGVIVIPKADVKKIVEGAEEKVEKDAVREHEALHNGEESIRAYLAKVVK